MTDTTTPAKLPHLLDIAGVAEHLGVDVRHVRRLVAERRIPFIKGATCSASTRPRSLRGSTTAGSTRAVQRSRWATRGPSERHAPERPVLCSSGPGALVVGLERVRGDLAEESVIRDAGPTTLASESFPIVLPDPLSASFTVIEPVQ